MKYMYILAFVMIAASAGALPFATKSQCESNNYFWCYRCNGDGGNLFGADTCVASNSDCTYSCSLACGADCIVNGDCKNNLTETTCQYSGSCSSCNCRYLEQDCPQNGTIKDGVCYFGKRECSSSGCTVSKCVLSEGQVCNPDTGCVYATANEETYDDYRCEGNKVFATKYYYGCNATNCGYSKYDAFIEECSNGCDEGECNDVLCNMNGIILDCDIYDGFYESPYCSGNDLVRSKRDYKCVNNECVYTLQEIKYLSCETCENNKCVKKAPMSNQTPSGQVTQPKPTESVETPERSFNYGMRIFNGWLFGRRDLAIESKGKNTINFTITDTNRFGDLIVTSDGTTIYTGRPAKGTMSLQFEGNIVMFTTSTSGWLFFAPAIYDIRYILIY